MLPSSTSALGFKAYFLFFWIFLMSTCQDSSSSSEPQIIRAFIEALNQSNSQRLDSLLSDEFRFPPYSSKQVFLEGLPVSKFLNQEVSLITLQKVKGGYQSLEIVENDLTRIYGFKSPRQQKNLYQIEEGKIYRVKTIEKAQGFLKAEADLWKWLRRQYPEKAEKIRENIKHQKDFKLLLKELVKNYTN